jgi:hypothetical protein
MSGWDVDLAGVASVTNAAIDAATPMLTAVDGLNADALSAIDGIRSASVANAFMEFFDVEQTHVDMLRGRTFNAISGVLAAAGHIEAGDYEMASISQARASSVLPPAGGTP